MVTPEQIIEIPLSLNEYLIAEYNAKKSECGGVSHVREPEDRMETLSVDQRVGQLGQLAGHKYLFGHIKPYVDGRWYMNRDPRIGDPGSDVACSNIDFKTSRLRYPDKPLIDYHLAVRPAELKTKKVFIQMVADFDSMKQSATVWLIGWATIDMLPKEVALEGVFAGAYILPCSQLHPLPPIKWGLDQPEKIV